MSKRTLRELLDIVYSIYTSHDDDDLIDHLHFGSDIVHTENVECWGYNGTINIIEIDDNGTNRYFRFNGVDMNHEQSDYIDDWLNIGFTPQNIDDIPEVYPHEEVITKTVYKLNKT